MKVMQFPSKYVQGKNAIELLPLYVNEMGGKSLVVVTKSQYNRIASLMGNNCQFSHHEPYEFDAIIIAEAIRKVDRRGRAL